MSDTIYLVWRYDGPNDPGGEVVAVAASRTAARRWIEEADDPFDPDYTIDQRPVLLPPGVVRVTVHGQRCPHCGETIEGRP